jgi:hypothetical protein
VHLELPAVGLDELTELLVRHGPMLSRRPMLVEMHAAGGTHR